MEYLKSLILTIMPFFLCPFAWGQGTTSTHNLTGGKWTICADMTFSKEYQCTTGYTSYEFFKNGTYKEDRQPIYNGTQMPYVPGKWTLSGNTLTMDEDDDSYHEVPPGSVKIVWLDSDRFYASGQEGSGGPTVYMYFQRTK